MQALQHSLAAVDLPAATRAVPERGYQLAAAHGARHAVLHVLDLEALALAGLLLLVSGPALALALALLAALAWVLRDWWQ
jgi:hypothetical protein